MCVSIIDLKFVASIATGITVPLFVVWISHVLQRRREREKQNDTIRVAWENLRTELAKNRDWFFLVKYALEHQFIGILKGLLQFNPVLGSSSSVYHENASRLLEICEDDVHKVHAISDVYEVIAVIREYLTSAEDHHYQRERFFWEEDRIVEAISKTIGENRDKVRSDSAAVRHEKFRIQFFTSELRDFYSELWVAHATLEAVLLPAGFTRISEDRKNEISNEAINHLIELRDFQVKEYRDQGNNSMADVIMEAAPLEEHNFGIKTD